MVQSWHLLLLIKVSDLTASNQEWQEGDGLKGSCEDSLDSHLDHLSHLALHEPEHAQMRPLKGSLRN